MSILSILAEIILTKLPTIPKRCDISNTIQTLIAGVLVLLKGKTRFAGYKCRLW